MKCFRNPIDKSYTASGYSRLAYNIENVFLMHLQT